MTWQKVKLGKIVSINKDSVTKNFNYNEIEYIDISSVGTGTLSCTTKLKLREAPSRAKRLVKDGDTILSTVRPNRRSFLFIKNSKPNLVVSTGFAVLSALETYNPKFIYYLINNRKLTEYLTNSAKGAAYPAVDTEIIANAEVLVPDFITQTKIASILSTYDDLIENNTRRIKILEEMAQTIYKEWFVNFRFPGYESTKFVDSPLGKIPEGWEVKKASEAIEINPRLSVSKTQELPFVTMDKLSTDSMLINSWDYCTNKNGSKFQNNDTLFARITPCLENGKTSFVQFLAKDGIGVGSTEFIVLRSSSLSPEYVYLLSRQDGFRSNAINSMAGASGRQRVHIDCFDKYLLANPPIEILNHFSEIIEPIFTKIYHTNKRNNNLRRTRDLLLPKLMSGEVEV